MFSFFVPGQPRGKGRPRLGKRTTYTDSKTREYEEFVKWTFKQKYGNVEPVAEKVPVAVFIIAYYKQPKSLTKSEKAAVIDGSLFPTVKPDGDNIAKIILDPLNKLAFNDDNQVTKLVVYKRFAICDENVGVKVFITNYLEHPELFDSGRYYGREKRKSN